ncbi:efflux transporter, RND family, MFP subunit [Marvinbryantia formatexigens DSM 14469]|uniref:Efflux transporter, RND family, MFP subunit n=1 Tax=Marvinbryantia formatexigens DSM 14469 TaxID=478749 RepID=C6LKP5_9FIRM|nr:biotin/lipoyl-binding protein [Marvinbryantia formatexigens]EET58782.1 efflux transporter, RND family, MFP subunit [Marvinbryantia formatexigens DSM 14469]UWO24125.1 biotin/lipoyl-binding protein [Marvinbryantia formatexigens DSM 14469]SDG69610.1 Biotin-lipoyl like [Marvinbryantia formatexigens]
MKKRVIGAFAGFLAVMLVFTFLSRAADSLSVARVTVQKAERGKINHTVTGTGKVTQNREQAVSTLAGQTVKSIYVEEGQQVKKGDVLFEIDLVSLKEQILEQKQEMKKADLQSQDAASSRAAQAQKNAISQSRAAEDYSVAASKGNTAVSRAAAELKKAKQKLETLKQSDDGQTGVDTVEEILKQTCEDKQEEYEEAVAYKEELEDAIDETVKKALADLAAGTKTAARMTAETEIHFSGETGQADGKSFDAAGALHAAETEDASVLSASESKAALASSIAETEAPAVLSAQEPDNGNTADSGNGQTEGVGQMEAFTGGQTGDAAGGQTDDAAGGQTDIYGDGQQDTADTMQPVTPDTTQPVTPDAGMSSAPGADDEDGEQIIDGETEGATEDPWLLEQRIRQENQYLLDAAQVQIDIKEQEKAEADAALASYQQEKAAGTQTSAEEMKAQLEEEIEAKQQAYEDAVTSANDSLRSAGRAIEDASAPQGSDSTGEIDAITREQEELKLEKLETLLEAEGKVTAPIDATVTKINLMTGEKTPDGTAMLLSDTEAGNKLVVQVDESQEKYIAKGDDAQVKANNKNGDTLENLTVDSVRTNEEDADLLDVTVQLPQDSLEAGTSATLESTRISETYDCCVPIQALYEDNGRYYVYVLSESSTVLGTELTVTRLDVNVLDKNETNAALQPGTLASDQQVIVSSDKSISAGSRVRLVEE